MVRFCLFFALVILVNQNSNAQETRSPQASLDALSWLAGNWGSDQNGRTTEETWMAPKGGMMLGINRGVAKNQKTSFEFLRIQIVKDEVVYFASPGGSKPTPFSLVSSSSNSAVFENQKHDFPQRITYRREQDRLVARIEGTINGSKQAMEWNWKKLNP